MVALDDKSNATDDEESLSDSSSYRDPRTVTRRVVATKKRNHGIMTTVKIASVPAGKPLCAKPRLVGADFLKTRVVRKTTKAAVPLKKEVSKARKVKRSSLSQDEKLFVEAAATLVQSGLCK